MEYENFDVFSRSNDELKKLVDVHGDAYSFRRAQLVCAQVKPDEHEFIVNFVDDLEVFDTLYKDLKRSFELKLQSGLNDCVITGNEFKALKELLDLRVALCMAKDALKNAGGE